MGKSSLVINPTSSKDCYARWLYEERRTPKQS